MDGHWMNREIDECTSSLSLLITNEETNGNEKYSEFFQTARNKQKLSCEGDKLTCEMALVRISKRRRVNPSVK